MRALIILAMFLLAGVSLSAQQLGHTLSGTVTDSATGSPIAGVSVFLNNTSKGTATKANGSFILENIPRGNYQLIFSAIGYARKVMYINGSRLPNVLSITLHTKATELATVIVEPFDKNGWRKYGKFFTDNFIGAGDNASDCKLLNKDALRFFYSKRTGRLTVTATEPLKIENDALGYNLSYHLEVFKADFNGKVIVYFGFPYFTPIPESRPRHEKLWAFKRKQAYSGSMMHFMRSLYAGRSITEGFLIEREMAGPNAEKKRVRNVYDPDFQRSGQFPMDTLHYFWTVLRQPDIITWNAIVPPDSILTIDTDSTRDLYFTGPVTVLYGINERSRSDYKTSGLQLITPKAIKIEENGSYNPPQELLNTGYWGQTEKICNLLPSDYEPGP